MAVESFSELLHKLKDIHEHELEGLQQKVLELTNKKNCDAKRLEELYNRNQQLREQHKMLTENIKQLENMLRAGLCDRCTVTQEMAKKRQQDYESSHLQSLQHISILMGEISALMKENERLREEVKNLRGRIEQQNGHTEEVKNNECNRSPDSAVRPPSLPMSALKNDHAPLGVATLPLVTVKTECERSKSLEALGESEKPADKGSENKPLQGRSTTSPIESIKPTPLVPSQVMWKGRRESSVESLESHQISTSSLISPHLRSLKNSPLFSHSRSEERPAVVSIPLRPHPIMTAPTALPWALPEQTDWVTAVNAGTSSIIVHPNLKSSSSPTIMRFPSLISSGLESLPPPRSPIHSHPICTTPNTFFEVTDSKIKRIAPCSWTNSQPERIFGENLREVEVETPLDLSSAGNSKNKETETDSSSSSSPPAPLSSPSSAQYASSPQSDPQTEDTKAEMKAQRCYGGIPDVCHVKTEPAPQSEERQESGDFGEIEETKERHKENGDDEKKKNENAYTESLKVPTLTISLRPVVVLETLKAAGQKEQNTEQDSCPQDQQDEEESKHSIVKKRSSQTPEAPQRRLLKEKRMRMTIAPQGPSHGDTEQG